MRRTYLTAIVIAAILGAWLFSGLMGQPEVAAPGSISERNRALAGASEDAVPTRVRVAVQNGIQRLRYVTVRGKTENKRTVQVKAELNRNGGRAPC